jgi:hypothetical protein
MLSQNIHDVKRISFDSVIELKKTKTFCRNIYIYLDSGETIEISVFSKVRNNLNIGGK